MRIDSETLTDLEVEIATSMRLRENPSENFKIFEAWDLGLVTGEDVRMIFSYYFFLGKEAETAEQNGNGEEFEDVHEKAMMRLGHLYNQEKEHVERLVVELHQKVFANYDLLTRTH